MWILQGETAVLQLQLYEVRDKLLRDSYETPMGPLTLCHGGGHRKQSSTTHIPARMGPLGLMEAEEV